MTRRAIRDLVVRFAGYREGDRGARALVRALPADGVLADRSLSLSSTGTIRIPDVDPAQRYECWLPDLPGGRYAWSRTVRLSDRPVVVPIQDGGTIRGRIQIEDAQRPEEIEVRCMGPLVSAGVPPSQGGRRPIAGCLPVQLDADAGTFEVTGVPPGLWTVEAYASRGDLAWSGETEARAGGALTIVLRRDE